jgi:hypothetical protein
MSSECPETTDPELDRYSEAVDERFILDALLEARKCSRTTYSMRMPRGEIKKRPTPTPYFMTELSST